MQGVAFRSCDTMTQEEFARWVETVPANDLHHYELLDGYVVMEPPAGWPHGEIEAKIVGRLQFFLRSKAAGRLFGSSQGFELPSGDTVEPDASFVSAERWSALKHPITGFPRVVPDLIVEILSPATKKIDQVQKKRIYERNGVREYWLVDPRFRGVRVFTSTAGKFDKGRLLSDEDVVASSVLEGLRIPVAELFSEE